MPINPEIAYNELPLLPPEQQHLETIPILKQESKAAVALAELKGLAKTLPNQSILINALVLKEARASSEVENIITTHDKLYEAITAKSITPDLATKEVLRYREALIYGFEEISQKGFLNTNGICRIQAILEENEAGIRKLPGTALKNDRTGVTVYTPPDDQAVIRKLMKNLEEYINLLDESTSPLIRLAVQHYQFESIHPFYDGNGRTGRIINMLFLILHGLLDSPVLYLSGFIINNKGEYYRLLQKVRTETAWQEWLSFMLRGMEETARTTIDQINEINTALQETIETVKNKAQKIYLKELIELLFEHPYSKIEFLEDRGIAKRKAAGRYLHELESLGILELKKIGKENIFINKRLWSILER